MKKYEVCVEVDGKKEIHSIEANYYYISDGSVRLYIAGAFSPTFSCSMKNFVYIKELV